MSRRDGRSARDARQLLERGAELARIEQFIADLARGQGGMLVIQGAAGIGKSALLGALCERAGGQGMQTLTARTSELEQAWSFGVVRQLLESRVVRADAPERAELLAGAAKLAGPVLGLGGKVGDSFAALHGLYWLMANLTIGAPVVAAIDDLQWADEPSLRWLAAKPDPAFVTACTEITGGNPFALHELMLDLAADGIEPTAAQAAVVAERVPAGVERAVLARLGRLDHAAQRLAQAVAVLGEDSGLRLAARMAELDIDTAAAAADALLTAELLAEGRPLRFAHPLVRSAVYQQLAPSARPWAHGRAARLLLQEGTELEKVAAQLLLSEPVGDLDAVQALRGAAAAALARGAPQTAGGYLRRALAEPPPQPDRAAILGELGTAERIGRDPAALIHLEQAWQATGEPFARARLADQLADVLFYAGDLERCSAVLGAALAEIGDRDLDLAVRLHSAKAGIEAHSLHPPPLERLWELAECGVAASRSVQLTLANVLAARGRNCAPVSDLVRRGLDDGRFIAEETSEALPAILAVYALVFVDELARAHDLTEAMVADARARNSALGFMAASGLRGWVALRRGALAEAEADTAAALELATEHSLAFSIPFIAAYLSLTLLERGKIEQAAAVVEAVAINPALAELPPGPTLFEARGRVRLARGQRAQGIADLRRCGRSAERIDIRNPNTFGWRSALALALASEDPEQARELAQVEVALARRVGAPRAMGIALRVCGVLADASQRIELLEQSVAVLVTTPMRLELAYSLTELGAALRRAGARTAAREPLRRALDLAHRCGATPLAQRAREEALAAGARPRRPWVTGVHALTASELRVVRLAAQDMGNREIAQALFITAKTVSDHLSSAYHKLNVSSRDQLAAVIAADHP